MYELLSAVLVYVLVFGADYLFFDANRAKYEYVSRRTFILFLSGQIALIYLFWDQFQPFVENIYTELTFLAIFLGVMLLFSYALTREKLLVCHTTSRTERCLTPGYVLIKGKEIAFQQLAFAAVALSLVTILGTGVLGYIAFILILLIMHTPVTLSMNKLATKRLTLGLLAISVPSFYIFTQIGVFWPAVYLHSLLFVVLWFTLANWDGANTMVSNGTVSQVEKVDK